MSEPVIFHDHLLGAAPMTRFLIERVESKQMSATEAAGAFSYNGQVHRSLMLAFLTLLDYRQYGQQTYCLGPRLQQKLVGTSIAGLPKEMIKFPYPCFYLATVDCPWNLWGGPTGWHQLAGILLRYEISTNSLFFYLWGAENENSTMVGDDASFWFVLDLDEAENRGLDIEDYIDFVMGEKVRDNSDLQVDPNNPEKVLTIDVSDTGLQAEVKDTLKNAIRLTLNLMLYVQHGGAEKKTAPSVAENDRKRAGIAQRLKQIDILKGKGNKGKQKKREKERNQLLKQIRQLSEAHVTWLGESMEQDPSQGGNGNDSAEKQKRIEHWVGGHWWPRLDHPNLIARHGLKWRQPYLRNKGSDKSEPSRQYKFREETDEVPKSPEP